MDIIQTFYEVLLNKDSGREWHEVKDEREEDTDLPFTFRVFNNGIFLDLTIRVRIDSIRSKLVRIIGALYR